MFSERLLSNEKALKLLAFGFDYSEDKFNNYISLLETMQNSCLRETASSDNYDVVTHLKQALLNSLDYELGSIESSEISIGVTGGFDSRLLYGALSEIKDIEKIFTFTFGCPGQYDYEFIIRYGNLFLKNHSLVNTNEIIWDANNEVRRREEDGKVGLYSSKPIMIEMLKQKGLPDFIIHGFLGDSLSGSARPDEIANTQIDNWHNAVEYFCVRNDYFKLQELLSDFIEVDKLVPRIVNNSIQNFDCYDILDYGLRQYQRIKANVLGDVNYCYPFENPQWQIQLLKIGQAPEREKAYFELMKYGYPLMFPEFYAYQITNRKTFKNGVKKKINDFTAKKIREENEKLGIQKFIPLSQGSHFCEWAEYHNNPTFRRFFINMLEGLKQRKLLKNSVIDKNIEVFLQGKYSLKKIVRARLQGFINLELNIRAGTISL